MINVLKQSEKKRVITILMSLFVAFSVNAQIKDFVILGGELSNSAVTSVGDIDEVLPRMRVLGLNTVLVHVYWELIEPTEGRMDFTLVGRTIDVARHGQRVEPCLSDWASTTICWRVVVL